MYKILIADAKRQVRDLLRISLVEKEYEVLEAENGVEALTTIASFRPDLVMLDVNLPVLNGLELCQELRKSSDVPIILLTTKKEDYKGISGLELGADDFVLKPISVRETLARAQAVLRRTKVKPVPNVEGKIAYEGLEIDLEQQRVRVYGRAVSLTHKELELLWCLVKHPNETLSRAFLLQELWSNKGYGNTRTVDTHVKRIRQKLNAPLEAGWEICTVWNVGYRFEIKQNL